MQQRHGFVAWVILAGLNSAWGQQVYPILLHRKVTQGDHVLMEVVSGQNSVITTTWAGIAKPQKTESTSIAHLVAEVTYVQVDESGNAIKESYKINSFTQLRDDGKGETELLPPQTVMAAEGGDTEASFTIDEIPVAANVKTILSQFIGLHKAARSFDVDRVWGTEESKRVGDQWIGNSKFLMEWMLGKGTIASIDPPPSTDAKLVAIEPYDDIPCMRVHLQSEMKGFKASKPPPDMTLKHASSALEVDIWLPLSVDVMYPRSIRSQKSRYEYEGVNQGRRYSMEQVVISETHYRMLRKLP